MRREALAAFAAAEAQKLGLTGAAVVELDAPVRPPVRGAFPSGWATGLRAGKHIDHGKTYSIAITWRGQSLKELGRPS